ncbi:MAG: NfeD family protein [Gammaproteobacteria bacterium]|jgi:membrane protein implicated in regulation of membrane protease activity|nr:NfeD family protein [Gammaproteobacteria bacterium]
MPWWGWIIFGAILFGSELMIVDAAFYLVFIGIAALITGLVGLLGIGLEPWFQWILFAVLSLSSMVLFRERLYKKIRLGNQEYASGPAGEIIRLQVDLPPGESGRLNYRGTTWTVLNNGSELIEKDKDVRIDKVSGLTLIVGKKQ